MRESLVHRSRSGALALVGAALALLLLRVAGDVTGKPLFEDEAVAGMVGARPVHEILGTVLWDRGGSPLHFLLVHVLFWVHESAAALRWLSVACALGAVVVAYDLGRRLAGEWAGGVAALVAASSGLLGVYASFGRMYALFALAGGLVADTFVRALRERTARAAALAAAAAWLLPAVHPYGGVVAAVELAVALWVWRGRSLRAALPVGAIALAALPFLVADIRLARRFQVGAHGHGRVATPGQAWDQLWGALEGFAGGRGVVLGVGLAAIGCFALARRERAFVVFALLALLAPPLLSMLAPRGGLAPDLSPRHLIYALPMWAALIGAGAARIAAGRGRLVAAAIVALLVTVGLVGPRTVADPRSLTYAAPFGSKTLLAEPAAWVRERVQEGDLLFPYSPVFLAALPESGRAVGLPRAEPQPLLDALRRAHFPVRDVFVAIPSGGTPLGSRATPFEAWALVRARGPFASPAAALRAIEAILVETRPKQGPEQLLGWFDLERSVVEQALSG
ncbi:MAG: mannosyltransferase [Gaiellaceae bacterium]|nr:mannosyltransferase [Gaiellaceae bacterium]